MPSYQDFAALNAAIGNLGSAMHAKREREKRDAIANALLNRDQPSGLRALPADGSADPGLGDAEDQSAPVYGTNHTGGYDEFQMQQAQDRTDLNKLLREAQLTRALQTRTGHAGVVGAVAAPYDAPEGTIWNGHDRFVRDPSYTRSRAQRGTGDPMAKLDDEMMKKYGVAASEIPNATHLDLVDATGKPTTDEALQAGTTKNVYIAGEVGGRSFRIPREDARPYLNRYLAAVGKTAPASTVVAPQAGASQPALDGTATATTDDPYAKARDAISRGADANAVKKRLADAGLDPNAL